MNNIKSILEKVYNNEELRQTIVPLFISNPGIGKTAIIYEFAKEKGVNIAPSSTSGHYIGEAKEVVELDKINETYWAEGPSKMVTENHHTLEIDESALITCQRVYNPFTSLYEKSRD